MPVKPPQTIRITPDVWLGLKSQMQPGETPNASLRRLLGLPPKKNATQIVKRLVKRLSEQEADDGDYLTALQDALGLSGLQCQQVSQVEYRSPAAVAGALKMAGYFS